MTPSTSYEYYNYKTKVNLVEWNDEDAETRDVDYVIKRHFSHSNGGVTIGEAETALNGCDERKSDKEDGSCHHPENVGHPEELDQYGGHSNEAWFGESLEEEEGRAKEQEMEEEEEQEELEEDEQEREEWEEEEKDVYEREDKTEVIIV